MCEMFLKMQSVGLTDGNQCMLPFTQTDIADATGLTPVHVNRTIQKLRREGLIKFHDRRLTIPDLARLRIAGLFNSGYLHLTRLKKLGEARRAAAGDFRESPSDTWTL